ncbi:homoserine O-acetyltransferase [Bacteroidia bacterium]|nr:homoserine O-acetyltransferase [Bacteroidia bacterium]
MNHNIMKTTNYNGHNVLYFNALHPIALECGKTLHAVQIAYHTYGTLNAAKDNVVWICHALTANSDAADWWLGMIGNGLLFDTSKYFIVCANVIGSCYGSTGPLSVNPATQKPYYRDFPEVTVRDMIAAHELLREFLGIEKIKILVGGSIGAFQVLEWSIMHPEIFEMLIFSAAGARTSPWAIALNEAQRMAIEADPTFFDDVPNGGAKGLAAARAIALTSYRNYAIYNESQEDPDHSKLRDYRVCSYQRYQGEKLVRRFDAYTYYRLTQSIDSYDISRGRGGDTAQVLQRITIPALIIGISTDALFPICEQKWIAAQMPNAEYKEVNSKFGHDGFLIENQQLSQIIEKVINN